MEPNKILDVLGITPSDIAVCAGVTKQAVSHARRTGTSRGKVPEAIRTLMSAARLDRDKIEAATETRAAITEFLGE